MPRIGRARHGRKDRVPVLGDVVVDRPAVFLPQSSHPLGTDQPLGRSDVAPFEGVHQPLRCLDGIEHVSILRRGRRCRGGVHHARAVTRRLSDVEGLVAPDTEWAFCMLYQRGCHLDGDVYTTREPMRIQNQEEASSSRPHKRTGPSYVTKVTGGVVPVRAAELLPPGDARLDRRIAPLEADIAWHHVLCHGDKASLSAPRAWLSPTRTTVMWRGSARQIARYSPNERAVPLHLRSCVTGLVPQRPVPWRGPTNPG